MWIKAAVIALIAAPLFAQTPAFETASVKAASPDASDFSVDVDPGLLRVQAQTLRNMVRVAYDVNDSQVIGGPKWADAERFDITARAGARAGNTELMAMFQTLLAERFKLTIHRDTRTVQGFAMVVAKRGVKMQKVDAEGSQSTGGRGRIEAKGFTMPQLAERLTRVMKAPVEDETRDNGRYNFILKWDPASTSGRPEAAGKGDADAPTMFTALEEQLGLKLEARKLTIPVIVIDSAEKPGEN